MPQLIEDIDAIARRKQRDVLYISFDPSELTASKGPMEILEEEEDETRPSWRKLEVRRTVIQWLDGQGLAWQPCGIPVSSDVQIAPYAGAIYVDVPFDPANVAYQRLNEFLENPDGSMRLPNVWFVVYSLKQDGGPK